MSLFSLSEKAYTILIRDMIYDSRFCFCGPQFVLRTISLSYMISEIYNVNLNYLKLIFIEQVSLFLWFFIFL